MFLLPFPCSFCYTPNPFVPTVTEEAQNPHIDTNTSSQVTTTITMSAFMTDTLSVLIACTLTYYLSKKLGWFKEENL